MTESVPVRPKPRENVPRWSWFAWGGVLAALLVVGLSVRGCGESSSQASQEPATPAENRGPEWDWQEFRLAEGDTTLTVFVGPGTVHEIEASGSFTALSGNQKGEVRAFRMSRGKSRWRGGEPSGNLALLSPTSNTTVRIRRIE